MSNDIVVQHVTAGLRRRISRHEQNEPPHDSSGGLHVYSGFGTDVPKQYREDDDLSELGQQ